jgi:CheY-like chemotaxis protein
MKNLSVLIVDDSEADRYILKRMLNELAFDISIFEMSDGESALEFMGDFEENQRKYVEGFPPLITFLDINMPIKDGYEYLSEFSTLRKKFNMEHSIVMMFTSSERQDDKDKALKYSFVKGFLIKGEFSIQDLQIAIEDQL